MTAVSPSDVARGDGEDACEFIQTLCRVTKDSIGGQAGTLIVLRPWQKRILAHLLARREDGLYRNRQALIGVARKNGKGLHVEESILAGTGWKRFGDLRPGDAVHAVDGTLTKVIAVSPIRELDCFRVNFADGQSVICDVDHLWTVFDRRGHCGSWRTVATPELARTCRFGVRGDTRYSVRMDRVVDRPAVDLPVDPYLLGVWLGDGTTAAARVTTADPEIVQAFADAGYPTRLTTAAITYTVYGGFQTKLRGLGVLGNKHVPEVYQTASAGQRMALLQGLMDSDGGVNCGPNTPRVEFANTNERLADAVLFLARSLGWKATIRKVRATLYGVDCGPCWRVAWTAHRDRSPFRLGRKTTALAISSDRPTRAVTNSIVSVERVETVPTRCITVAHESGQFLVGSGLLPTHNSALGAALAIYGLVCGPAGAEVYSCAGDRDQARIVFGVAKRMIELEPELADVCHLYRDAIMVPSTGGVYRVLSAEAYTKEGLNPTLTIFDEVHVQPNREFWDVMALATGARIEPMMVGITTAGVRYDSSGGDSLCYGLYEHGKRVCKGEVDDPSFFMGWWEPVDAKADHRDPDTWREANPGFGDLVSAEDFAASVVKTPEQEFRIKRVNQWIVSKLAWLPAGAWDALDRGEIPDGNDVVLGFDGSFNGDSTALVAVSVAEKPHIEVVECWERPAERGDTWQVPILDVEEMIRKACRRWQVKEIACDPYRWARTYQILEAEGLPIVEFPQSPARMTPATTRFYEAVVNKAITHSGDLRLARDIGNSYLRADSRGTRIYKEHAHSTRRIDLAVAAVMALERAAWWHSNDRPSPFFAAWR